MHTELREEGWGREGKGERRFHTGPRGIQFRIIYRESEYPFPQKHKLEESRKDPAFSESERILVGKKKEKEKPNPDEISELEAQKVENSKEGSERDQKLEEPKTPS